MIPQKIDNYEVRCLLGEGTFGEVFGAWDSSLSRFVAIKMLRSQYRTNQAFLDDFRSEAVSMAAVAHQNVIVIHSLTSKRDGMVVEYVPGHTLSSILHHRRRLEFRETLAVTAQLIAGLSALHRMGLVHRDVKPANIMLATTGVAKIMDFGIAHSQALSRSGRPKQIAGTPAYMAPEQIKQDNLDSRCDLYGLACVIYEMLSGRPPFEAATEDDIMRAHVTAFPDPITKFAPGLPQDFEQALMRGLAKRPEDRFATVSAFGDALGISLLQGREQEIVRDSVVGRAAPVAPMPSRPGPLGDGASPKRKQARSPLDWATRVPVALAHLLKGRFFLVSGVASVCLTIVGGIILLGETSELPLAPDRPATAIPPIKSAATTSTIPAAPQSDPPAYEGVVQWSTPEEVVIQDSKLGRHILGRISAINLFGIIKPQIHGFDAQEQRDSISNKLTAFVKEHENRAACYVRDEGDPQGPTYQCFMKGIDMAKWAIENHLGRLNSNAPQTYRDALKATP